MSAEDVEALRKGFEAFNSGELRRILEFAHPDFEVQVPPELSAEPDTYRGHDGIRRYFRTFADAMEEVRFSAKRLWDAGESIVVDTRMTAKGRQTSIPVEQRFAQIWTLRDGKAIRVRNYTSVPEALQVAGLPPELADPDA